MSQVINGRVRDADGRPVAEARAGYLSGPVPLPDIAALTDADGTFVLAAPVPGGYEIICSLPDGTNASQAVDVRPGEDATVTFALGS